MKVNAKERAGNVDFTRFVFALCIMFGHLCWQFYDVLIQKYPLIEVFGVRMGVQFFFMVSGYYYMSARLAGKNNFVKQLKSLLQSYLVWTCVYYFLSFVINIIVAKEPIGQFLLERVVFFFTRGSYAHLWYMVALIYAIIMVEVAYRIGKEKGWTILAVFASVCYIVGVLHDEFGLLCDVPLLGELYAWSGYEVIRNIFCLGLPFVMLGYGAVRRKERFASIPAKRQTIYFVVSIVVLVAETCAVYVFETPIDYKAMVSLPICGIVLFLWLQQRSTAWMNERATTLKRLSAYIYFVHPAVMAVYDFAIKKAGLQIPFVLDIVLVSGVVLLSGYILLKIKAPFIKYII